ncbi:Transcriptional regulator, IclR family [Actinomycetales bacterium JB111]|nr:Transcriptional regulator, IclR family [Actinomycetales bacterium JB111]
MAARGRLTATELAHELDVSKPTAFRLARALVARDWLVQSADRSYRLGPAVRGVAARTRDPQLSVASFFPVMERLAEATGETIQLTQLDGRHVVYLEQIVSAKPVRSVAVIGARSPAHAVSAGLSQLALLPEEVLRWFLIEPLALKTPNTITDPRALGAELARIRERGYAVNRGGHRPDIGGVGIAIPSPTQQGPLCAINICAPVFRLDDDTVASFGALLLETVSDVRTEGR